MKRLGPTLLVICLALVLLGCSDFDDQPGMSGATATNIHSPVPIAMQVPTQTATPAAVASPTAEPGGWVWLLVGTDLNPEQNPTKVAKSDSGSRTWFEVTDGGCTIDKVEFVFADVGKPENKVYDYKIDCSCDQLPSEVWPGEEYRLDITCSGDLRYVREGNFQIQGQVAISYYSVVNPAHRQFLQPYEQQFWFRPWHPDYDGATNMEWVFFGPWGELGDEFELVARCGEAPCKTHWRYRLVNE